MNAIEQLAADLSAIDGGGSPVAGLIVWALTESPPGSPARRLAAASISALPEAEREAFKRFNALVSYERGGIQA